MPVKVKDEVMTLKDGKGCLFVEADKVSLYGQPDAECTREAIRKRRPQAVLHFSR